MKKLSEQITNQVRELRITGHTHRQIAKLLKIGQGSAVTYSQGIPLTESQKIRVQKENYKKSFGKLTQVQRITASKKGGHNTSSHFKIKYSKNDLIILLQNFYKELRRIPTKRDFVSQYHPFLRIFKTWNNAIREAGFIPNPVLFAKKFTANDGHHCDSLTEKIIDDWFTARHIPHIKNARYDKTKFTADFKVGDTYIEFFGLHGQLNSYDKLMKRKLRHIRFRKYKLISLYPNDIYPKSKLDQIFKNIMLVES